MYSALQIDQLAAQSPGIVRGCLCCAYALASTPFNAVKPRTVSSAFHYARSETYSVPEVSRAIAALRLRKRNLSAEQISTLRVEYGDFNRRHSEHIPAESLEKPIVVIALPDEPWIVFDGRSRVLRALYGRRGLSAFILTPGQMERSKVTPAALAALRTNIDRYFSGMEKIRSFA